MESEKEMWKEVGAARRVARGTRWKMKRDGTNGAARKERKRGTWRILRSERWLALARISSNALVRNAIGEPV